MFQYTAINWTNSRILLVGPFRTNLSDILIEIQIFFFFTKMRLKMSSGICRTFWLSLSVLKGWIDPIYFLATFVVDQIRLSIGVNRPSVLYVSRHRRGKDNG